MTDFFFRKDWKIIRTQIEKEIFIFVKNIVQRKNWFVFIFHDFP